MTLIRIHAGEPRHKAADGPRFPGSSARKASAEASARAAAPSPAKAPATRLVDLKAERATAYASGFRAAGQRLAAVMASPTVKGREGAALKLLSDGSFDHLNATAFLANFTQAVAAGQASTKSMWDNAHAEIAESRGDAA